MTSLKRWSLLGLVLSSFLLPAVGCGTNRKTVKVEGIVTLDGKPLPGATVTFSPIKDGPAASGRTDTDGSFRLTTYRSDDGAVPGEYKVVVVVEKETESSLLGRDPTTFSNEEKLRTRKSMSPQGKKAAAAAKKAVVSPVPAIYGDLKKTPLKEVVPPEGRIQLALRSSAS